MFYVYMFIYIYIYTHVPMYIYIYIERERDHTLTPASDEISAERILWPGFRSAEPDWEYI